MLPKEKKKKKKKVSQIKTLPECFKIQLAVKTAVKKIR